MISENVMICIWKKRRLITMIDSILSFFRLCRLIYIAGFSNGYGWWYAEKRILDNPDLMLDLSHKFKKMSNDCFVCGENTIGDTYNTLADDFKALHNQYLKESQP